MPDIDFSSTSDFKRIVPEVGSDWFGWVFSGQLLVQQPGSYNLCITSDDGSMLYIFPTSGAAADYRLLIDDDGLHGPQQRCRALTLTAGRYPVKVTGFQAAGGVYMQARYSGPDTGGNLVSLPSADSTVPEDSAAKDGWTMQVSFYISSLIGDDRWIARERVKRLILFGSVWRSLSSANA